MKRLFTLLLGATFGCGIQAQYLPNTGFEAWKEVCGSSYQAEKSVEPKVSGNAREPNQWIGTVQA